MAPHTNNLTNTLRRAIEESGLSLLAVAQTAELSYPVVYDFAHGNRDILLRNADKLAAALGLELRRVRKSKGR